MRNYFFFFFEEQKEEKKKLEAFFFFVNKSIDQGLQTKCEEVRGKRTRLKRFCGAREGGRGGEKEGEGKGREGTSNIRTCAFHKQDIVRFPVKSVPVIEKK